MGKYDCGCGQKTYGHSNYGRRGCCNTVIQAAPEPCCVSHETIVQPSICFHPTQDTFAVLGPFFLTLENDCSQQIPLNANDVYFYHAGAGLLRIIGKSNGSYQVELVDATRAGAAIRTTDCVMVAIIPASIITNTTSRCLVGNFVAPALNGSATIFLSNASSVPLGSTITFTANGATGSYVVTAFISAEETTYAYTVQNVGQGHVPGTIIDGGEAGGCLIPVELITEITLCDLATSNTADHVVACKNDAAVAFKPTGEGDIMVGTNALDWELRKVTNLDCCVIIDDCLKFSGETCPAGTDSVRLRNIGLACFEAAYFKAAAAEQVLAMNINGFPIIVTSYDGGTKIATFAPAADTNITIPLSYAAGTQICLGDCCASCVGGVGTTEVQDPLSGVTSPLQGINAELLNVPVGLSYWLIGLDNTTPQTVEILRLTAPWFAAPGPNGPLLPKFSDPFIFRQKICNNAEFGCNQFMELQLNYLLAFDPMPAGMQIDWEFGHYAADADTLANGQPNPFNNISTQQKSAGRFDGPSVIDATLFNTSFGNGIPGENKVFPYAGGDFRDLFTLIKCDCALSVLWLFVRINSPSLVSTLNVKAQVRRHLKFFNDRRVPMPLNTVQADGWG